MNETLETAEWAEQTLLRWQANISNALLQLQDSAGAVSVMQKRLEALQQIDRTSLARWHRAWIEWQIEQQTATPEPEKEDPDDDGPEWFQLALAEIASTTNPLVKFKLMSQQNMDISPAKYLGQIVGSYDAGWRTNESGVQAMRKAIPLFATDNWIDQYRAMILVEVDRALQDAITQPPARKLAFFEGYTLGAQRECLSATGTIPGATNATICDIFMVFNVGFIERLHSVHELQHWLELLLGPDVAGDVKRVEKFCQRRNLKFAKPGRPRNDIKNSDA